MTELIPSSSPDLASAPPDHPPSPHWGLAPKMVVGQVVMVLAGTLISRFHDMLGPLMFALIFAYLMNPLLTWVTAKTKLSWGVAVNLIFLVLFFLLVAGLTAAVVGIVQQSQGLYRTLVDILPDLPTRLQTLLQTLLTQPFHIGTFTVDLSKPISIGRFQLDLSPSTLTPLLQQVVAAIQPALSQAGGAVGSLATVTASMFGWMLCSHLYSNRSRRLCL